MEYNIKILNHYVAHLKLILQINEFKIYVQIYCDKCLSTRTASVLNVLKAFYLDIEWIEICIQVSLLLIDMNYRELS